MKVESEDSLFEPRPNKTFPRVHPCMEIKLRCDDGTMMRIGHFCTDLIEKGYEKDGHEIRSV